MTITWKRTANALLVAVLAVLLCARLAGTARADVFDVSTPQQLQSAITAAAATVGDDTINLAAATYDIGSTISTVNLRAFDAADGSSNAITLVGAGSSHTILDGDGAFGPVVNVTGSASMAIRDLTIRGSADDGLDASQGNPVTLSDDVVRDNGAFGISGASLQITGTTISGNGTTGLDVECGIIATNDTVANNTGVGVHIDCTNPGDALKNLTVAGNGGAGISFTESIELDNSIVAGNAGGDCDISGEPTGSNDLIGSGTCGTSLTGVVTGDPLLGPLQDNGGPTPTMALRAGSPAIDAGKDSLCPTTDQRGTPRPLGPHCDIGAFELQAANHPPTLLRIRRLRHDRRDTPRRGVVQRSGRRGPRHRRGRGRADERDARAEPGRHLLVYACCRLHRHRRLYVPGDRFSRRDLERRHGDDPGREHSHRGQRDRRAGRRLDPDVRGGVHARRDVRDVEPHGTPGRRVPGPRRLPLLGYHDHGDLHGADPRLPSRAGGRHEPSS